MAGQGQTEKAAELDPYFSNAKFILICLVVLAHGMEPVPAGNHVIHILYKLIYLFHMPVFIFISGYFSARQQKMKLGKLLLQYAVFQIIYVLVGTALTPGRRFDIGYDLFVPFWVLWFHLSLVTWKLLIPYTLRCFRGFSMVFLLCLAVAAGYTPLGLGLSLSRTLVFAPFFLLGYLAKDRHIQRMKNLPAWFGSLVFLFSVIILAYVVEPPDRLLYGSTSYDQLGYFGAEGAIYRLLVFLWSLILGVSFLSLVPKRKQLITRLGANTMQVYLFHGLPLLWLRTAEIVDGVPLREAVFLLLLLLITFVLATDVFARLTKPLTDPVGFFRNKKYKIS